MSENLSVGSLLEKTGQWMQTVDGNEDRDSGFFFLIAAIYCLCIYVFVHALTFTVYKGQRTAYKNWLSPSFILGNEMQIVKPGSKFLYVLSHPARLKESHVSEWGFQTHSVADSEGLALGKCFCDKCLYRLLWGCKGSNDLGESLACFGRQVYTLFCGNR